MDKIRLFQHQCCHLAPSQISVTALFLLKRTQFSIFHWSFRSCSLDVFLATYWFTVWTGPFLPWWVLYWIPYSPFWLPFQLHSSNKFIYHDFKHSPQTDTWKFVGFIAAHRSTAENISEWAVQVNMLWRFPCFRILCKVNHVSCKVDLFFHFPVYIPSLDASSKLAYYVKRAQNREYRPGKWINPFFRFKVLVNGLLESKSY